MPKPSASAREPVRDELPLVYVGGDPALDLVNTIDWLSDRTEHERLTSYARLTRWAEGAGVLSRREAQQLRHGSEARPHEAAAVLADARLLRLLLMRLFHGVAHASAAPSVWNEFDAVLGRALARLRVSAEPGGRDRAAVAQWRWRGAGEQLDSVLWPIAWSAARLLTSAEARGIRICAGPDCGWVFVDRSRNHLRRWCQMTTCGTAAKTRRRRVHSASITQSPRRISVGSTRSAPRIGK